MLPTFLVIGAMKAGTTSLHAKLAAHPEMFMASPKELHFFVESKNWGRGRAWYESKFDGAGAARARGEISPSYSQADVFPGVPERIAEMIPDVKIVYLVRDPIERLRSMYLHQVASGRETRSVADAVANDDIYVNASRYAWQLERFRTCFPRDQIHVVTTDQLRLGRLERDGGLFSFLGVRDVSEVDQSVRRGVTRDTRVAGSGLRLLRRSRAYRAGAALVPRPIRAVVRRVATRRIDASIAELPSEIEAALRRQLALDVVGLRDYLGPDFDCWGLAR